MRGLAAGLLALALAAPLPAAGLSPTEVIEGAGARIAEARAALGAEGGPEERAAALTRAVSDYEAALVALRGAVIGAEARERELTLELRSRRGETARLLAALQALSRTPRPAQALHPQGPIGAARAAGMLARLTPELQAEADALAAQLAEIEAARGLRARGLGDLSAGLAELGAAREALRDALDAQAADDPEASPIPSEMLREAETLSALAAEFAGGGAAESEPLALRWPVTGEVLRGFRAHDAAGVRRPGLVVQAAPLSLVMAPADARVRYAGPFLDYGYVVVLEPRADVLITLAGLATLETQGGATVRAGEALGLLGGRAPDAQEFLMLADDGSGETAGETLYIEVRHGQGPVDPAPWFEERNG